MKLNSKIWLFGAVALGLAACSDDEYTGEPQVVKQPAVLPADCVAGTDVYAPGTTLDVNAEKADIAKMLPVINLSRVDEQPEDYEVMIHMLMAKSVADLDNPSARLETTLEELTPQAGAVKSFGISARDLNVAFHTLYGISDAVQPLAIRFDAYSVKDLTSAMLGTVGTTGTVNFKPVQYAYVPENSYYLVNQADPADKYEMKNSGGSVWDEPTFAVVFTIPAGNFTWKVVPASIADNPVAAQCFGPGSETDDNGIISGDLKLGGNAGAMTVAQEAPYMVSVNMVNPNADYTALSPTYEIKKAYDVLYILGNAQDGDGKPAVLTTKDYVTYGGFVAFSGWGCKMTNLPAWGGTEFGGFNFEGPDDQGKYTATYNPAVSGNIGGLPDGIYAWVFNITTGAVTATPIEYFELIGTATGGWGDVDTQRLSPDTDAADCAVFSADINFKATGDYKLRGVQPKLGNAWAYSLGGEATALEWDGPNTIYDGALGVHKLTVSFNVAKEGDYAAAPRVHYVIE